MTPTISGVAAHPQMEGLSPLHKSQKSSFME